MRKGETHRKYSLEEKQKILTDREKNKLTYAELSSKYSISKTTIRDWSKAYDKKGIEGLSAKIPGKKNNIYTPEFRISVVNEKLSEDISYRDLSKKYCINRCVIQSWVYKYEKEGEAALLSNKHSKAPKSNYPRTNITKKEKSTITKEIFNELNHLRAEVAYLKKLNALTWEKEQSAKKKKLI